MTADRETPGQSTDSDRSVFLDNSSGSGERFDPFDGPFYAAVAHAPLGGMVIGVISGVLSAFIVSLLTLYAAGEGWLAVAGFAALFAAVLMSLWLWIWRNTDTGHKWINRSLAIVMSLSVAALVAATIVVQATGTVMSTSFKVTMAVGVLIGSAIAITAIKQGRRDIDPELREARQANLRALVGVDPPPWGREQTDHLARLEQLLGELNEHRPVPVRASSLGEWWRLRPSWSGPYQPVDVALSAQADLGDSVDAR